MAYQNSNDQSLAFVVKSHPWATPRGEAEAIRNQTDPMYDPEMGGGPLGPEYDGSIAVANAVDKWSRRMQPEPGLFLVTSPGQTFHRPALVVTGISNLTNATLDVTLGEGEGITARKTFRVTISPGGSPPQMQWKHSRAMAVKQIFTSGTNAGTATAQIQVAGTWGNGKILTVSFTTPNPVNPSANDQPIILTMSYTVVSGDVNNTGSATSLATAINASILAPYFTAAAVGTTITLTAVNTGSLIQQGVVTTSATPNMQLNVLSQFAGAVSPEAAIAYYDITQ